MISTTSSPVAAARNTISRNARSTARVFRKIECRSRVSTAAYPSDVSNSMWSPTSGPGSEATVVEVFSAWLAEQGWECAELPSHGDYPGIDARHPDGRRLIAEAKGFTRDSAADLDTGY